MAQMHVYQFEACTGGIRKDARRASNFGVEPLGDILARILCKLQGMTSVANRHGPIRFIVAFAGEDRNGVVGFRIKLWIARRDCCDAPIDALAATPAMPPTSCLTSRSSARA